MPITLGNTSTYYSAADWVSLFNRDVNKLISHEIIEQYLKHPLNKKLMTHDAAEIQAHADIINTIKANQPKTKEFRFKQALFNFIHYSKRESKLTIGAANAITILNAARVPFSDMNLSGIQIPEANLNYAILHRTNLTGANLNNVQLRQAFLNEAILSQTDMTGVVFGENPYLPNYGDIIQLVYHAKNNWLLLASDTNSSSGHAIYIIDMTTKTMVFSAPLTGHEKEIIGIYLNEEGTHLLSASKDGIFKLWDVSGNYPKTKPKPFLKVKDKILAFAMTPNESYILVATYAQIQVYNFETKRISREFSIKSDTFFNKLCFSQNGNYLAATTEEGDVFIFNVSNKEIKCLHSVKIERVPSSISFSQNEQWVCVTTTSGSLHIINTSSYSEHSIKVDKTDDSAEYRNAIFAENDSLISVSTYNVDAELSYIKIYSVPNLELLQISRHYQGAIYGMSYLADTRQLLLGSSNGNVYTWEIEALSTDIIQANDENIRHFAFIESLNLIAELHANSIRLRELSSGYVISTIELEFAPEVIAVSSDAKLIAVGGAVYEKMGALDIKNGIIELWDITNLAKIKTFKDKIYAITALAFSSDNKYLASTSRYTECLLIDIEQQSIRYSIDLNDRAWSLKFSHDNKCVVFGKQEGVACYSIEQERIIWAQDLMRSACLSIDISRDSQYILTTSTIGHDNTLSLLAMENGRVIYSFKGHNKRVECAVFSPCGQYIASSSNDKTVKFWLMPSFKQIEDYRKRQSFSLYHEQYIYSLEDLYSRVEYIALSSQGFLVACSKGVGLSIWHIAQEADKLTATLINLSGRPILSCKEMSMDNIEGLEKDAQTLLMQHGAKFPQESVDQVESAWEDELYDQDEEQYDDTLVLYKRPLNNFSGNFFRLAPQRYVTFPAHNQNYLLNNDIDVKRDNNPEKPERRLENTDINNSEAEIENNNVDSSEEHYYKRRRFTE